MKQAQLTVYIIMGILALLFLGVGSYVANRTITQRTSPAQNSISAYVTDCLQTTAKDALLRIGTSGGYIEPLRRMKANMNAAEGDVLLLSDQPVAYWWYLKSANDCNSCDLSSQQTPTLEFIAKEVSEYLIQKLPECAGFDTFIQQGAHVSTGNASVRVDFTKDDVLVDLEWPIVVVQGETETKINSFETRVDAPIKQIYEVAQEITLEEKNNATLERLLLHIIGLYSDTSQAKLPPFSAVTHDNRPINWNKNIVEQYLTTALTSTVPLISYGKLRQPAQQNTFEEAALAALKFGKETPFEVRFHYFGWPIYFDITPNDKGILLPEVVRTTFPNNIAPPFQTNTYEFFYDLSVPLLVEIRDKNANKGEGYSFFFALEANIRDNKELKEFHTGEGTYGQFNAETIPEVTALQRKIVNRTLFCDEEQKLSGTTKINVIDGRNNTPVPEASLSYGCGKISSCLFSATNSHGTLKTKLPICYNGHLRAEKQGYAPTVVLHTTEFEKRDEVNITLQPLRELQFSVKKYDTNGTAIQGPRSLASSEQAIIILNRVKEGIEEQFQAQTQVKGSSTGTILLIPGTYEVRIILIDEKGFMLPAKCMQVCEAYDKEGKCAAFKQLPEKSQNVKPAMLGGVVLNNNTGLFEITDYTLDKRGINALEFYVIKTQTPTCVVKENCVLPKCVGIDEIGRTEEYSKRFSDAVQPRFLRR